MREGFGTLLHRIAALFRRRRLEKDLDDELRSHLEMAIELNARKGMSPADARREALRSFGGLEQTKEIYRDQRGLPMIETTLQDLRFGLRMLRRSAGFSILAILCLTLGIGANAAVFSWIEGILFRPYPAVAHQERLVAIGGTSRPAFLARFPGPPAKLHALRNGLRQQNYRHHAQHRRSRRAHHRQHRLRQLLRRHRGASDSGSRLFAGRGHWAKRASRRRHQLSALARSLPWRSANRRQDAAP